MMEAASTSETLVNVYQTTRRYNPEDSHRQPEGSLSCSQEPTTGPYPEPHEPNPHLQIKFNLHLRSKESLQLQGLV
jgi:hypothetical protein